MKRVTLDDLMQHTGTGERTTRRLVREGKLPGFVDGTTYICSPGEFQRWVETGEVLYRPVTANRKPVQLVQKGKVA